jgi:hypothetical protein
MPNNEICKCLYGRESAMNMQPPQMHPVGSISTTLRHVVLELHRNNNAPVELIALFVLGTASLICQNSINVRRPNCLPSSGSLDVLVIAGSAEGKPTLLEKQSKLVREFESDVTKKGQQYLANFEASRLARDIEQKVILADIEMRTKREQPAEELKTRLARLISEKPKRPLNPKRIYEDMIPETFVQELCEVWPAAAVLSLNHPSIRKRLSQTGSCFGLKLIKLPNRGQIWKAEAVAKLPHGEGL